MDLSPAHFKYLRARGLNDKSIETSAFRSLLPTEFMLLSPTLAQCESVLEIPFPDIPGYSQYRIFPPLDGMKCWIPPGSPLHVYIPPTVRRQATNPNHDLAIAESAVKALCLTRHGIDAVGLMGV